MYSPKNYDHAVAYMRVKHILINKGFHEEIDWQDNLKFEDLTVSKFLTEFSWVVLSSGMRFSVINSIFPQLMELFKNWIDVEFVVQNERKIKKQALRLFNHESKINSIFEVAQMMHEITFKDLKRTIETMGTGFLITLPFIGKITCFHLAKNIGLDVAKPDRHLERIANALNYPSPHELCNVISQITSDKISVVDLVLWRFAEVNKGYIDSIRAYA